ncbi:hypothetical protein [Aphanothece sacrum]|nr:hypothetical protein [Aphanothece sacrum]
MASMIVPSEAKASPTCYGIDQSGAAIDLSAICNSSPKLPSTNNHQSVNSVQPQSTKLPDSEKKPNLSEDQRKKDIQNCFNSPRCREILAPSANGNNSENTPHQDRIERVRNGGAIKHN